MKYLLFATIIFLYPLQLFGQSFVSPINFVENQTNKEKVISFIKKQVKEDYTGIGMDSPSMLRMMEQENLDAFKKLTKVKNKNLLKRVIKSYCDIGMCNYTTILMMYQEENSASKKQLDW